jgi:hypothetical protein
MKYKFSFVFLWMLMASTALAQRKDLKFRFNSLVADSSITWIFNSKSKITLPDSVSHFPKLLLEGALEGKFEFYDVESGKVLSKETLYQGLHTVDTVYMIDPITLEQRTNIFENTKTIQEEILSLSEVWYFDNTSKTLNSKIYLVAPYLKENGSKQKSNLSRIFEKEVNAIFSKNIESQLVERTMQFDTVFFNNFPLKICYNEGLADILWKHLAQFTIVDKDGTEVKNYKDLIYKKSKKLRIDPMTLEIVEVFSINTLEPEDVAYFKIEELWQVDYENLSIYKTIKKVTPVFNENLGISWNNVKGEFEVFSILFEE